MVNEDTQLSHPMDSSGSNTEQSLVLLAQESMVLLGRKAEGAPASLDKANSTLFLTSSAAMEQPILVAKSVSLQHDV